MCRGVAPQCAGEGPAVTGDAGPTLVGSPALTVAQLPRGSCCPSRPQQDQDGAQVVSPIAPVPGLAAEPSGPGPSPTSAPRGSEASGGSVDVRAAMSRLRAEAPGKPGHSANPAQGRAEQRPGCPARPAAAHRAPAQWPGVGAAACFVFEGSDYFSA